MSMWPIPLTSGISADSWKPLRRGLIMAWLAFNPWKNPPSIVPDQRINGVRFLKVPGSEYMTGWLHGDIDQQTACVCVSAILEVQYIALWRTSRTWRSRPMEYFSWLGKAKKDQHSNTLTEWPIVRNTLTDYSRILASHSGRQCGFPFEGAMSYPVVSSFTVDEKDRK